MDGSYCLISVQSKKYIFFSVNDNYPENRMEELGGVPFSSWQELSEYEMPILQSNFSFQQKMKLNFGFSDTLVSSAGILKNA